MLVERIRDLDDPRIAIYRSLKTTNLTRRRDQFVVEGEKLVRRLRESRYPLVSILTTERYLATGALYDPGAVPVYVVPDPQVHELVGFRFHRGVLGCGRRVSWPVLDQLLEKTEPWTVVICPRLSDPANLGAIARIGDAFGIDALLLGKPCPDPFSRRVLRVSMGSVLRLSLAVEESLASACSQLAEQTGAELWAAVADPKAEPYDRHPRPRRLALVVGEEDQGIADDWLARCQRSVTIPMRPGADSLNVSVATGILLHHFTKPAAVTDDGSTLLRR
jgi:tRNA G18 (ribose-2'-O)-methylase SpoU